MNDMYDFEGIKSEGIFLLAQNRFENNKDYYEQNKERIKKLVMIPVKQIAAIIGEDMFKYDPQMELDPNKMVSRIRRDTRFSKNKDLYRENVWIMFMRNKKIDTFVPCFWFEFYQDHFNCGVTFFDSNARVYEIYRQMIRENPSAFRKAVKSCLSAGCILSGHSYKKPKEFTQDIPKDLRDYYNMKNLTFMKTYWDISMLESDSVIDELKGVYEKMNPYYQFLLKVYEIYKLERSEISYEQRKP